MNYPMNRCLEDGHTRDTVLGVSYHFDRSTTSTGHVETKDKDKSTFQLFYFILDLFFKLWYRIKMPLTDESRTAPYQLDILYNADPNNDMLSALKNKDKRRDLIDIGVQSAEVFMKKNDIF